MRANAPFPVLGMSFPDIICSGCYVEGVAGMHWQCAHCYEYHLCHSCYLLGRHCQEHPFFRVQSKEQSRRQVHGLMVGVGFSSEYIKATRQRSILVCVIHSTATAG